MGNDIDLLTRIYLVLLLDCLVEKGKQVRSPAGLLYLLLSLVSSFIALLLSTSGASE